MNKVFLVAVAAIALAVIYLSARDDAVQELSTPVVAASGTVVRTPTAPTSIVEKKSATASSFAQHHNSEARDQAVADDVQAPELEQRISDLNQLYPYREFSQSEVADLLAQPNAWESSAELPEGLLLTDEQRNDGRAFVELNPERFQILLPGDTIELPLEKLGMHLQVQVDSREPLANGGFTLHGHVLGGDELMRVTITQGPGLTLAGMDTPQGHIIMQANDTQGWVASSETLFKQNPHKTDVLLPTDE